jgi:cobalt/nickel transport protein
MYRLLLLSFVSLAAAVSPAVAHYQMLLPNNWSAKKDEPVTFTYQWGHPFEHQLFEAPTPEEVVVIAPDGKVSDLTKALEKITVPSGDEKVTAYRLKFKPDQRGDYVVVLRTPPIWMKDEEEFWQDTVKVVLHVQAQKGWDHNSKGEFQWSPLTRPYGLQPGMVFQAQISTKLLDRDLATLPGRELKAPVHFEIERYNAVAPKTLPSDEQITRTGKTDTNGVATCTLTESGWWALTGSRIVLDIERRKTMLEHDGKMYPLRERSTLWVYVDEKPAK